MPKKQAATTESVVFNGIKFRRYPLSNKSSDRNYYRADGRFAKQGIRYLHHEVWKSYYGAIPEGYHVHHKDEDTSNNAIENLELVSSHDHLSFHCKERFEANREKALAHLEKIRAKASEWHKSPEGRAWHSQQAKESARKRSTSEGKVFVCEQCGMEFKSKWASQPKYCSDKCASKARRASGADKEERTCPVCGKSFTTNKYKGSRTCSRSCGGKLRFLSMDEVRCV